MLRLQVPLLDRAAEIIGGPEKLCEHLGVSEFRLRFWRSGRVKLPDQLFIQLVDLILQDDIARAAHDRRRRPRWDEAFRVERDTGENLSS